MFKNVLKYNADYFQIYIQNHIILIYILPPGRCTMRTLCYRQSPILHATTTISNTVKSKKIFFLDKIIKLNNVNSGNKNFNQKKEILMKK